MDRFDAFMTNYFRHLGAERRGEGVLVRIRVGAEEIKEVMLPREHVTLLPPDEILVPQWLCEERGLVKHVERTKVVQS